MKVRITTLLALLGLILGLGPWLFLDNPSTGWYWVSLVGGLMVAYAGYDAQAKMIGLGEPGELALQKAVRRVRAFLFRDRHPGD